MYNITCTKLMKNISRYKVLLLLCNTLNVLCDRLDCYLGRFFFYVFSKITYFIDVYEHKQ